MITSYITKTRFYDIISKQTIKKLMVFEYHKIIKIKQKSIILSLKKNN